MAEFKPISPPVYVFDVGGSTHSVFGWFTYPGESGLGTPRVVPAVANPDGPGIGPWHQYYGDDPWTIG